MFTYDAGLRIRPPEPIPECVAGESAQAYIARVLSQCSLESATTAENSSGDSAPTPFNLGQVQRDVAENTQNIATLQEDLGDLETTVNSQQGRTNAGTLNYADEATTVAGSFDSEGTWRVFVQPIGQALVGVFVTVAGQNFTITFEAAPAAGSLYWFAIKE